jgi:hypothetical protein
MGCDLVDRTPRRAQHVQRRLKQHGATVDLSTTKRVANAVLVANPAPSLNQTKFGIRPSLRLTIPSSNGLGEGTHEPRHNRFDEIEGTDEASATRTRGWAAPANEAMTPQIRMIVSNSYTDELGNQARIIKARD